MNKLIVISLLLFSALGYSQDDEIYDHGLDQDKWQDIREGIRYEGHEEGPGREWTYESNEEYNRELERYENSEGNGSGSGNGNGGGDGSAQRNDRRNGNGSASRPRSNYSPPPSSSSGGNISFSGLGVIGWIILIVFVAALVVLIFYLFINIEKKGPKIKGQVIDLEEVNPTEIPLTELQRMLQEAIAKGDYRGAVRIYFIFIVRDLAQKNWIQWEKEKTNFHYLREMSGKNEFDDFNVSVSYFEIIWYGKREIDEQKFEKVKPKFTRFLDKLGVK